ncbi:MAG: hypothetical protein NT030_08570, partial [Candidatus Saganbacteria bacterium]|nr:hypothetical protein [Candidatus Saganbacteria bacterium]
LYGGPIGEDYRDLNYDGQFDLRSVRDKDNQLTDWHIYLNHTWVPMDRASHEYAVKGNEWFRFDQKEGWVKYSPEKNENLPVNPESLKNYPVDKPAEK